MGLVVLTVGLIFAFLVSIVEHLCNRKVSYDTRQSNYTITVSILTYIVFSLLLLFYLAVISETRRELRRGGQEFRQTKNHSQGVSQMTIRTVASLGAFGSHNNNRIMSRMSVTRLRKAIDCLFA